MECVVTELFVRRFSAKMENIERSSALPENWRDSCGIRGRWRFCRPAISLFATVVTSVRVCNYSLAKDYSSKKSDFGK